MIAHIVDIDERYEGYCLALRNLHVPLMKELVYREGGPEFSYERGVRAARYLLESKIEFDGVVAQSDEEALGIMNVLMDRGIRVPQGVRLIGMDNAPYCCFSQVPLSSVSQSSTERGRVAFNMLMALIEGDSVQSVTIPPQLFVRESSQ
jgi:LacI family transcriptional regulator